MANFEDLKDNWIYYIPQLPKGYNHACHYEDVRYTNWEKLPVIMPAIKELLSVSISLLVYFFYYPFTLTGKSQKKALIRDIMYRLYLVRPGSALLIHLRNDLIDFRFRRP